MGYIGQGYKITKACFRVTNTPTFGVTYTNRPINTYIRRKCVGAQDPSFFNLQKIAEGSKHALIQARLAQ